MATNTRPAPKTLAARLFAADSLLEVHVPGTKGMVLTLDNARQVQAFLAEHIPAMEAAAAVLAPAQPQILQKA